MNPYAVLMLARSLEQDRERAVERRRLQDVKPPMPRDTRVSWSAVRRFPRLATSGSKG
jgi:hypothetical protein